MQPCKTGDQLYSDASPYSECSLEKLTDYVRGSMTVWDFQ